MKEDKIDQRLCRYQPWKVTVNLNSIGVYENLKHTNMIKRIGINVLMTISNSKAEHCNIVYFCILYTCKATNLLFIEIGELLMITVRPVGYVKYQE